ncbi:type II toxin-antitoxin system death-on-curing family toxin [Rhizobium mongolense]|uniref:Death-on-curing protein n=1 Tax=Rhizobium mongolense TaxID=57676 RepID=A0A7W6RMJ1_9HYPH|nr:type II toxin-antitoxin system death-on-curing family toxin [Rhizobium mongolense]MBB4274666.1 death-on-curing protein [Rhizobium mongolense]
MTTEPLGVTADEVITLNERIVASTGERHVLRDRGALEGALARPQTFFHYEDVTEVHFLAGYLILSVGKAHAFEQGNKRTAWLAGVLFILNNGYKLTMNDLAQKIIADIVERMMSDEDQVKQLIFWLDKYTDPAETA